MRYYFLLDTTASCCGYPATPVFETLNGDPLPAER
jgi:hypothetical protein